jgi:hypothetical protein
VTIKNGLYYITVEMSDGIQGGNRGVMVMRDGTAAATRKRRAGPV